MQSLAACRRYVCCRLLITALLTHVSSQWLPENFHLENELMLECVKGIPQDAGGMVYTGHICN